MNIDLLEYGYIVCGDGWSAEWQSKFHHKIYYCISGTAYYTLNGKKHQMSHNYFYIFPIFARCEITHENHDPFEVLWLHINTTPALFDRIGIIDAKEGYYRDIASTLKSGIDKGREVLHALCTSLIIASLNDGYLSVCYDKGISYILNYIGNHCDEKLTNEMLCEKISYSKNHFIQLFKKHTGLSPHVYIKLFRLEKAKQYLQKGYTVADTASLCGYSSPCILSREFKRHFGVRAGRFKSEK